MSQADSDVLFDPVAMAYLTDEASSNVVNQKQSAILKMVGVPDVKTLQYPWFPSFLPGKAAFELPPG